MKRKYGRQLLLVTLCCTPAIGPVRLSSIAHAAEPTPYELRDIGITEALGEQVPLDLSFVNEAGDAVTLSDYVTGARPVILTLVYYECPSLCGLLLNGFTAGLSQLAWTPGAEFDVVTISINPREGPPLATQKKAAYLESYGRPQAATGWHWLTGTEAHIRQLADVLGFHFRYDAETAQYAHAAGIFIVSPTGTISRYLYGIEYRGRDLKLALMEAAQGKIGSFADHLLLYCYRYDPVGKKYALFATNLMKGAAGVMVIGLGGMVWRLSRRRERVKV